MNRNCRPPHRAVWSGLTSGLSEADIGIMGIAYDGAASFRKGAAQAPERIRSLTPHVAPYTESGVALAGLGVYDAGDVQRCGDWSSLVRQVSDMLRGMKSLPFLMTLGGDHSITIPVVKELSEGIDRPMGYLHIDAHLDLMDTFEGSAHSHACTARRVLELPHVSPKHVAFVGIRSWLGGEIAFLKAHPDVHVETAEAMVADGIPAVFERTLPIFADVEALYVSIDIDVLDPAYAPGTGTPEAAGLSTRQLLQLLARVFETLPVRALDIVEVCPPLDHSDITSFAAIKLIYEVFGWIKGPDNAWHASV